MKRAKPERQRKQKHDDTSPVKLLESELHALRRDLRATARAYTSRLEGDLLASASVLGSYDPVEKLSRDRLHQVRDLAMMVRNRRLKPEKGRRKDLRKIDTLIADLQLFVGERQG
jgi:hypothetical protein